MQCPMVLLLTSLLHDRRMWTPASYTKFLYRQSTDLNNFRRHRWISRNINFEFYPFTFYTHKLPTKSALPVHEKLTQLTSTSAHCVPGVKPSALNTNEYCWLSNSTDTLVIWNIMSGNCKVHVDTPFAEVLRSTMPIWIMPGKMKNANV